MILRVDRARSTLLGVFLLIAFVLYFRSREPADDISVLGGATPGNRIAIACMTTDESTYDYKSLSNKFAYAEKHGYHMEFDWFGDGFWHKLHMVERLIQRDKYDWIWWIDFDTIITNTTIKLEDLIQESLVNVTNPDKIDMILTPDCFPLNAGSMLFRSNARTSTFLKDALACRKVPFPDNEHPSEQDCMAKLIKENKRGEGDRTLMIPQWKMNAFPEEIPCFGEGKPWERGMFVIHFAGAWAHMPNVTDPKGTLYRKYQWQIVGDEKED